MTEFGCSLCDDDMYLDYTDKDGFEYYHCSNENCIGFEVISPMEQEDNCLS